MVLSAAELEPAARAAWIVEASGGDTVLQQQAMHMLQIFTGDDSGLERAVAGGIGEIASEHALAAAQGPGTTVGAYRIIRRLASGGMGSVFLAERSDEHFHETVAIKIVHTSVHMNKSLLSRFRLERQVLAKIRHPNIASLLDGGVTGESLPYLVMEYIEGEDILNFVRNRKLSERAVLELFRTVCTAVQHAHKNLIVHRDLKPGNILVTPDGQPKLLDFGIAKLLSDSTLPALAEQTMAADRLMTLQYASPEQINGGAITTATDIYGLGATLYELLTGEPPFAIADVSLSEAQRLICDTAPVPPSLRRHGSPRSVSGSQTDLDRILLKALHKSPDRRYASVAEFSDDIQRYLTGFPVHARPDSRAYRVSRFVHRHVLAVGSASVALIALLVLLALLSVQTRRARREAASADAVAAYLIGLFDGTQPDQTHGRNISARELLDHGSAQLNASWHGEPVIKARLLGALGRIYYQLGDLDEANKLLNQAQRTYIDSRQADPLRQAEVTTALGAIHQDRGESAEAIALYRQALLTTEKLRGRESEQAADILYSLGETETGVGDFAAAQRDLERAASIHAARLGATAPATLADEHDLESLHTQLGEYRQADTIMRGIMAADEQSHSGDVKSLTASDTGNMAYVLDKEGRIQESYPLLQRSLELHRQLYGPNHPRVATPTMQVGWYMRETGQLDEAERYTAESVRIARATQGEHSLHTAWNEDALGLVYLQQGLLAEARSSFQMAMRTREAKARKPLQVVAQSVDHLGQVHMAEGNNTAAHAAFEQALALRKQAYPHENDWFAINYLHLGHAALALGNVDEASRDFNDTARIVHASFGDSDHPLSAQALTGRAEVEARLGHIDAARSTLNSALAMQRRIYGAAAAPDLLATERDLSELSAR